MTEKSDNWKPNKNSIDSEKTENLSNNIEEEVPSSTSAKPRHYMDEVVRLSRQFPDQKEKIVSLRKEFPELNLYELRALLITEIQERPFNSTLKTDSPPRRSATTSLTSSASKDNLSNSHRTRLVQSLRTPQKVTTSFNKLGIRHQKQMSQNADENDIHDADVSKDPLHDNNNNETTIANIPSISLTDESFLDMNQSMDMVTDDIQKACIQMVNPTTGHQEWRLVDGLEQEIIKEHLEFEERYGNASNQSHFATDQICTKVFIRDPHVGLGMTIREKNGSIFVHALVCQDGVRYYGNEESFEQSIRKIQSKGSAGPAQIAGVRPGDRILGLNGKAFLPISKQSNDAKDNQTDSSSSSSSEILRRAAQAILNTPDPVVLHVCPSSIDNRNLEIELEPDYVALTNSDNEQFKDASTSVPPQKQTVNKHKHGETKEIDRNKKKLTVSTNLLPIAAVHPFATALTKRGLLQSGSDESIVTMQINKFSSRTRQWENTSFLRVDRLNNNKILPENPLVHPPQTKHNRTHVLFTPSTPAILPSDSSTPRSKPSPAGSFPGQNAILDNGIFIPLTGIRKSLCVRIVNAFVAGDRTAYTIWIYDIELGKEWYAPVRYYQDFKDLRSETMRICSTTVAQIPFPTDGWKVWGGGSEVNESGSARETRCKQLERFLRTLCGIVYTGNLNPRLQEVAVHLQSFLGCDTGFKDNDSNTIILDKHVAVNSSKFIRKMKENVNLHSVQNVGLLLLLKRSLQRYTNRIFLLPITDQLVSQFIDMMKSNMPTSRKMNAMKKNNRSALKQNAQSDLNKVKDFLNQMQDLILDGSIPDFNEICRRDEYVTLTEFFNSNNETDKSTFFSDCVREQIEIEVYLPLRSSISKHLVHGWRNDDLEMQFKMQELRKRPQSYFKIHPDDQSPTNWDSVSKILSMGVGMSTLPCEKLQAIVDAAKEVARLYDDEHNSKTKNLKDGMNDDENEKQSTIPRNLSRSSFQKEKTLSADDFLPIFIFCVVRAELERPCALCVLLRTLCDPSKRIGEMGYYLASFEAAISHIGDWDLSEDNGFCENPPLL